jgi:hypothetical protein
MYNVNKNIDSESSSANFLDVGIHEDVELKGVEYKTSPKENNEFMVFHFEKDGKKWVKFVVTDPREDGAKRYEMEAPLVRTVRIKEPGEESERRSVVRLGFQIGDRKIKAEFSLNNRHNMICPVLIGRSTIRVLGWIDPSRTYLADDKIIR